MRIQTYVELQRLLGVGGVQPQPGRDQRLRHVVAVENALERLAGEFRAAIGAAAGEAADGFEEQPVAIPPQALGSGGGHHLGGRNAAPQDGDHRRVDAPGQQLRRVAEQRQIALVGVERMLARVGRQHHPGEVGVAQRRVAGRLEIEVGEAVVDQIHGARRVLQPPVAKRQLRRVGEHSVDAVGFEQLLEQQKLRVQVLAGGMLVDDGDARQRPLAAGPAPFVEKHLQYPLLRHRFVGPRHQLRHRVTAGMGRSDQLDVEQRAAGIGVHLDEPRPFCGEMEVVPLQDALSEWLMAGHRRGRRQHVCLVERMSDHGFDGGDDLMHLVYLLA